MFVYFHDVNIAIMAVSVWRLTESSWEEVGAFGSYELVCVVTVTLHRCVWFLSCLSDIMSYLSQPVCSFVYADLLVLCSQHAMFMFPCLNLGAIALVLSVPPIDNYVCYSSLPSASTEIPLLGHCPR